MMFSLILSLFLIFVPQIASSPTGEGMAWLENRVGTEGGVEILPPQDGIDSSAAALPRAEPRAPQKKADSKSLGIETTARSALVFDRDAGEILFEKNSRDKISLASLTKLMTALVVLDENPDWDKTIKLVRADDRDGGIVYARSPEVVTVNDLFQMTLVGSVNNAAMALVRSTGITSEGFVAKMNAKAGELGLKNTIFADPTGLMPENQGTARDVAKLLAGAMEKEEIKKAVIQKKYVFNPVGSEKTYYVKSTDELLWSFLNEAPYAFVGGKTGYIEESGYNLAVEVERDGHRVVIVVLGSASAEDRFREIKGLADWTFENYQWQ